MNVLDRIDQRRAPLREALPALTFDAGRKAG